MPEHEEPVLSNGHDIVIIPKLSVAFSDIPVSFNVPTTIYSVPSESTAVPDIFPLALLPSVNDGILPPQIVSTADPVQPPIGCVGLTAVTSSAKFRPKTPLPGKPWDLNVTEKQLAWVAVSQI